MSGVEANPKETTKAPDATEQAETQLRRQISRAELYGMAVLLGHGMAVVYVIGTLVLDCIRS